MQEQKNENNKRRRKNTRQQKVQKLTSYCTLEQHIIIRFSLASRKLLVHLVFCNRTSSIRHTFTEDRGIGVERATADTGVRDGSSNPHFINLVTLRMRSESHRDKFKCRRETGKMSLQRIRHCCCRFAPMNVNGTHETY
jgi:hypothetical protein